MRIKGNTVGFPNPQPDWKQTDISQADYIKNKPAIDTTTDGYTEISGMRRATSISVVKSGKTVTVTRQLSGGKSSVSTITLGDNDIPVKITTDGKLCYTSWEGF